MTALKQEDNIKCPPVFIVDDIYVMSRKKRQI